MSTEARFGSSFGHRTATSPAARVAEGAKVGTKLDAHTGVSDGFLPFLRLFLPVLFWHQETSMALIWKESLSDQGLDARLKVHLTVHWQADGSLSVVSSSA
jgi:hypothetical protein